MIKSVELSNFLSHRNNEIKFDHGVTVILGHNGAGKSSIMDAIIFSMFGANRRESVEKLLKEGENQAYVKTSFEINGKIYHTVRKIQNGGTKAHELTDESGSLIAKSAKEAEDRIKEIIELDYNELRIASIVPADELTHIITEGSELRSLIDKMMGAEKYSKLELLLKEGVKNFRTELQEKHGYTYENLVPLQERINEAENNKEKFDKKLKELKSNLEKKKETKNVLSEQIEEYKENAASKNEYQKTKDEFIRHIKNVIGQKRSEYEKEKEKFERCNEQFPIAEKKEELGNIVNEIEERLKKKQEEVRESENNLASLIEQEKLAKKLQLTDDGECPVCNRKVEKLNDFFQEDYIKTKKQKIKEKLSDFKRQLVDLETDRSKNQKNLDNSTTANIILNENGISNKEQLDSIEEYIEKQDVEITSFNKMLESEQFQEVAIIDSTSTSMYDNLVKLEKKSKEFDEIDFEGLKKEFKESMDEYDKDVKELGRIEAILDTSKDDIENLTPIVEELNLAKKYVENINKINSDIFSTQSKTFTGLRYFALRKISDRASNYLEILKTQVQRVNLFQERASVKIDCETISGIRPVKNLSSGEQACVALSIRLAMAEIMTKSPLKVMILDEPTAHLDQEHCELFLDALQQLTSRLNQNQNFQFIISTHQEDLWANSKIGTIYKLENPTGKDTIIV